MAMEDKENKGCIPRKRGRFAHMSQEEIDRKRLQTTPVNTVKANLKAAKIFRDYLIEKGSLSHGEPALQVGELTFENLPAEELNDLLKQFYFNARTVSGQKYKTSSLENFRHSLNRYLKSPPISRDIDIVKDPEFRMANECFKAAMRDLKAEGKGVIDHHSLIKKSDLNKIYQNLNTESPLELFKKVQFDIRFYFFRRGIENMAEMTKETFVVKAFPDIGLKYVTKAIDELNKNHSEQDKEGYGGFMMEDKNPGKCPVRSFQKLLNHLHPDCNRLWQKPREAVTSNIWFYKHPVGKDTLGRFMRDLSEEYKLSQIYTNHSIRVTGATILSQNKFAPSQIMAVTGHKSVNSLAIYQRVSDEEKVEMGETLKSVLLSSIIQHYH